MKKSKLKNIHIMWKDSEGYDNSAVFDNDDIRGIYMVSDGDDGIEEQMFIATEELSSDDIEDIFKDHQEHYENWKKDAKKKK